MYRPATNDKISMKNSKISDYEQNQNGRPSRYVKTGRKTKKGETPKKPKGTPLETRRDASERKKALSCAVRPGEMPRRTQKEDVTLRMFAPKTLKTP